MKTTANKFRDYTIINNLNIEIGRNMLMFNSQLKKVIIINTIKVRQVSTDYNVMRVAKRSLCFSHSKKSLLRY